MGINLLRTIRRGAVALTAMAAIGLAGAAQAEMLDVEKDELKFGFIKLTDMAPLAVAYEKGYFEDEGLFVTLEPQANWKVLLDRVITGELDGAHMLAGQPLAATIGFGTEAHIITPFSMDLNGNGEVTREEIAEYRAKMREQRTGSRADRFERADTDKNGSVSAAEARAAAEAQLSKLDSNGDGELSRKEMRKGFKHGKRQAGPWADDQ